jgi:hypothetical protein
MHTTSLTLVWCGRSGRNSLDVPNLAGSLPGSYPGNSLLGSSYPGNMMLGSMGADDVSQGVPSVVRLKRVVLSVPTASKAKLWAALTL